MNRENWSITDLAQAVNEWCHAHHVEPMHNRVGTKVSVRNIRYYQTLGMVSPPAGPHGCGFSEKQRLQLIAIRLLQAKGLPLQHIRITLSQATDADLRRMTEDGIISFASTPLSHQDNWRVIPLSEDFLLMSRQGQEVTEGQKQRLLEILHSEPEAPEVVPNVPDDTFRPEID